jgi:hypothetical protein
VGRTLRSIACCAALLLGGCGLFEPRDPLPGGGPGSGCLTPNNPDNVVTNIVDQYAAIDGITCYTSMLDTAFTFHPDAADSIEALPDPVYANWNRAVESDVAAKLAADATFHFTAFDSQYAAPVISSDQRTQTRFYAYHLIVRGPIVAQAGSDTLFKGLADITFFQGSDAQWHVTTWVDKRDASGSRTWGYLRRLYRI